MWYFRNITDVEGYLWLKTTFPHNAGLKVQLMNEVIFFLFLWYFIFVFSMNKLTVKFRTWSWTLMHIRKCIFYCLSWILLSIKMKLGEMLVWVTINISSSVLVWFRRVDPNSGHFSVSKCCNCSNSFIMSFKFLNFFSQT